MNALKVVRGFSLAIGICLSLFTPVFAQQPMPLTIENAVQAGLQNNKILHSSTMKIQFADAKTKEINGSMLPSLKFAAGYSRLSDVPPFEVTIPFTPGVTKTITLSPAILDNYNLRLALQQPVFTGFRLTNSLSSAKYNKSAAEQDYNKDKAELVYNIKNAYWNLSKAIEYKKVVDENVEQVKLHLDDIKNLFSQGVATNSDVLKVQAQLSNTQLLQINAKNNVQLAAVVLNNLLGLPLDTEIQIESKIGTQIKDLPDRNMLIQKSLKNHAEIKSIEYRIKSGESAVAIANSSWYPQIFLSGNYYYSRPNQRILPARDEFKDTWDIGISASLDLWNWGTTIQQTKQANAQLAQTRDTLSLVKDKIVLEVTQNYLSLIQAKETIDVAKQVVQQAEENYRITREKFKVGLILNSELIDAEVLLLQSKTSYTNALADYEIAQARLEKSIGE